MRCLTAILIALLMTSAANAEKIKFCFLFCIIESEVSDSFVAAYKRVILSPADSADIKKLPRPLRERLTANETLYRCETDWRGRPICSSSK